MKQKNDDIYFDDLNQGTKDIIRELILSTIDDSCDGYPSSQGEDGIEDIECHSRDGFIPFSSNRGGLTARQFTDLNYFLSNSVAHKKADAEIKRQIEYSLEMLSEHVFLKYKDLLIKKGITEKQCTYSSLQDLAENDSDLKDVLAYLEGSEYEFLSDSNSSIMFEVRFMYHGKIEGTHSASISCAVNTEGPYHRSSISWAHEIEIEWTNQKELKNVLIKALNKASKKVF